MPYPTDERPVIDPSAASMSLLQHDDKTILPILIWAETRQEAQRLDEAVKELLSAYSYDVSAALSRQEFKGSWGIKISFRRKAGDVETDLQAVFGSESSPGKISPKKRGAIEKLKHVLEVVNGWIVVGTLCLTMIAGAMELVKEYHKAFQSEPTSTTVPAAKDAAKIGVYKIPPAMMPALENADKNPEKLKLLVGFVLANQIHSPFNP